MRKSFVILIYLSLCYNIFAQTNSDKLIINSLSFLNKNLPLNFEIENQYILVFFEGDCYIVDKYIKDKNVITREMIRYELKKQTEDKYSFSLIISSEYSGSFELTKGEYEFFNLRYVKKSEPLFSLPKK